jgi:protein ImuB
MRRVVSLYLPTWPTDRFRKSFSGAPSRKSPIVIATREGSRRIVAAVDDAASALGLRRGLTIAHAQALVPNLHVVEASPTADNEGLARLATWCVRYSPLVAVDPPDGVWIEVSGSAHLFGGEAALIDDLISRLRRARVNGRAAIADTPGAAWAVARFGGDPIVVPGGMAAAIAELPIAALRLLPDTVGALNRVGVERIGQVAAMPSAPLTRRFGAEVRRRLDQALGHAAEPFDALMPPEILRRRLAFAEPIADPEDLARVVERLCFELCEDLTTRGVGARRLDLVFGRVDKEAQAVRVGTGRPTRDPAHISRLLGERLDTVDPGFGVEDAILIASRVEPLAAKQIPARWLDGEEPESDVAALVDRLSVRFGESRVYRQIPVESDLPERSVGKVPALAPPTAVTWPAGLSRPTRLFDPPELVEVLALLPDNPPAAFIWRRVRRRVVRADGPERVGGEWWRSEQEVGTARDYYRVEDEKGRRYWLFRDAPAAEGGRWFLHGLFG